MSKSSARPCDVAWIRAIVEQCAEARVPCFVKQLGAVPMESEEVWRSRAVARLLNARNHNRVPEGTVPLSLNDRKGGDPAEWPAYLRVRQMPGSVSHAD